MIAADRSRVCAATRQIAAYLVHEFNSRAGTTSPGRVWIAAATGLSYRSVSRGISRLIAAGFLEVAERGRGPGFGGPERFTTYRMTAPGGDRGPA